jgi:hypothetical protein
MEFLLDAIAEPHDPDKLVAATTLSLQVETNFERVAADGERYLPHCFSDGFYRVADPSLGRTKHHAANQILIRAEEIENFLKKGFLLRMRGNIRGQVNLISAAEVKKTKRP